MNLYKKDAKDEPFTSDLLLYKAIHKVENIPEVEGGSSWQLIRTVFMY